jgi:regulator of sigma E protease
VSVALAALLAALGFIVLIILHEFGHFAAAKAVGMRVERFSLFFPPLLARKKIGETEYAIGALPLGGYVRISGMNPSEDLPDEVRTRAYYAQPVWKRMVVILAGPAMNFLIAFVLFIVFFWLIGAADVVPVVGQVSKGYPAYGVLHSGDRIVSIDGQRTAGVSDVERLTRADRCAQRVQTARCPAARPLTVEIERHGQRQTVVLTPIYDPAAKRTRLGFAFSPTAANGPRRPQHLGGAVATAGDRFWYVSRVTASLPARIFNAKQRKQIHGIVGSYETTRQTILHDPADTVGLLAIISLALAVVNLFPFLPLDGGHVFWGLVELVRRKPVPFSTMERASFIGFALVMMLFVIGFTNDVSTLSGGGFQAAR